MLPLQAHLRVLSEGADLNQHASWQCQLVIWTATLLVLGDVPCQGCSGCALLRTWLRRDRWHVSICDADWSGPMVLQVIVHGDAGGMFQEHFLQLEAFLMASEC